MASYKKGSVTVCFLHSNAGILVLYFVLLKSSLFIDFSKVFLGGRVFANNNIASLLHVFQYMLFLIF
jgi:hypothetical protein